MNLRSLPQADQASPFRFEAVAIGASAGALESLSKLLPSLPATYRLPILVVVHVPPDKKSMMADLLQSKCRMHIKEADDKEPIEGGTVYFAPPDYHLLVEIERTLALSSDEPVKYSRPSIDVLFESAADAFGSGLIGIVLTGANDDGAVGLRAIITAGGVGLVLEPERAFASTMPEAARKACPEALCLGIEEIAAFLLEAAALA